MAVLLPSRAPAALVRLPAFAPWAPFLDGVAFFPDLPLAGVTRRACCATLAFLVPFGSGAADPAVSKLLISHCLVNDVSYEPSCQNRTSADICGHLRAAVHAEFHLPVLALTSAEL